MNEDNDNKDCYFSPEEISHLEDEFFSLQEKYQNLLMKYTKLNLNNAAAYEYAHHGFLRRLGTLKRCIENIYKISSPDNPKLHKPSRNECLDLGINLQSFVFNIFGCLDNLAWIWVLEKQLKDKKGKLLTGTQVCLFSKKSKSVVRETFSTKFQKYLNNLQEVKEGQEKSWYDHLEDFRHGLAHRIPLYVPPFAITPEDQAHYDSLEKSKFDIFNKTLNGVVDFKEYDRLDSEQDRLGFFLPVMSHSFSESSPSVVFHVQVLSDWNTIVEISEKFLEELETVIKKS